MTKFHIFLSSPSDLSEERAAIEDVIVELNQTWGRDNRASIEVLSWEKNVPPGFASEPQEVINKALGETWDIFLGLMHARFGTPTVGYGSGTEEEFEKAFQKWEKSQGSCRIMFYFKKGQIDLDKIDTDQLTKVRAFQKKLSSKGGLYKHFDDVKQLELLLRAHLAQVLNELLAIHRSTEKVLETTVAYSPDAEVVSTPDELGILDHVDVFEVQIKSIADVFKEHNAILGEMTEALRVQTIKINEAGANKDYKALRVCVTHIALSMVDGGKKFSQLKSRYSGAMTKLSESMSTFISLSKLSEKDRELLKLVITDSVKGTSELWQANSSAQKRINDMPNMAGDFHRARIFLNSELRAFNSEVHRSIELLNGLLSVIE